MTLKQDDEQKHEKTKADYEPWIEKYRPKKLSEVVGQEHIIQRLESYVAAKEMPHMLFAGRAGIGKTTSVLALAHELYGDAYSECFLELNASDERGIDIVRGKIKDFARSIPLASVPFKIIFLDEADALTAEAQQALRRTMERYSENTRFILSCNYSSRIIEPIQSRCAVFRFLPLSDEHIGQIVDNIAKHEGLHFEKDVRDAIVAVSEGDARKAANVLQGACSLSVKVTAQSIYKVASRATPKEVATMVGIAIKGDFSGSRKMLWEIMGKYGLAGEDVLVSIYREVTGLAIPDSQKVALVDKIGEYDFRMVMGADETIQLEALLAQMSLIGKKQA
jgi:replication factor C small subunit